ncbi:MAG TPA: hypothetical protein DDY98_08160 [Ruminococcaceae bacterium]|nr:hypothetical protein [Oscillospiraceae bacterium]
MKRFLIVSLCLLLWTACLSGCAANTSPNDTTVSEKNSTTAPTAGSSTNTAAETDSALKAENLVGDYQDSVSGRASATVELDADGETLKIDVSWANSASETVEWSMTATLTNDNRLVYTDCKNDSVIYADNGTETRTGIYKDGSGYFTAENGKLLWNGAADANCKSCVFEKIA